MRSVDCIFFTRVPAWRIRDIGQNGLQSSFQTEVVAAPVTATFFSLPHSSTRPLSETQYNNYTMHQ